MNTFDNLLVTTLHKSLDGLWKRQEISSENMANYETPGYKRKAVSFEDELKSVLQKNNTSKSILEKEVDDLDIKVDQVDSETLRLDGNNVDLEKENLEIARTTLDYMYTQRILNDYFSRLRCAINDGRK